MRQPPEDLAPGVAFSGGNTLRLLRGGAELFPAMHGAIARAQQEVWLATYIFHDDEASHAMALALAEAGARGVKVCVVVDGFGSKDTLAVLQQWLVAPAVGLAVFRPVGNWWSLLQPGQLRRLHQKLCVVDGEVGFVGGINIIDDCRDLRHGALDSPRLDFAVELRGPLVAELAHTVRAMWTRASLGNDWRDEVVALARSAEPLARARRMLRRMRLLRRPALQAVALQPVQAAFLVRDNIRQRRAIERWYVQAIRRAQQRVDLVTPYFYPGRAFRRALCGAARRGVQVRLLLQGKPDYRFAAMAAQVLYAELLADGVQIFEYTAAFLHAKVAVVDGQWATVGSSNIDPLSLLLNLEANVVVNDAGFAADLSQRFEEALAGSRQVVAPDVGDSPVAFLRRGFVATVARWFLRMAGITGRY
ncbi:phosphatidylserine/phosphatidylglycerophosphate/cardiolipin synthase [Burkholderiales bacterium JOSHI_001]|nr:phosphatidylserine/phosphatidylglycerophosphate/cardiolipin synthase [Burkholderiales bacterium JOSHI_001]